MPKSDPFVVKLQESLDADGCKVDRQSLRVSTRPKGNCQACGQPVHGEPKALAWAGYNRVTHKFQSVYACLDRRACHERVEKIRAGRLKQRGKGKRAQQVAELKKLVKL